jgi:hypothetical protein
MPWRKGHEPMSCTDPAASLLVFHANGTLVAEERRRVEAHAEGCSECRALLGLATLARGEMADPGFDPVEHVQAQLLSEFVETPEALGEETRAWVASHLQLCDVCASVVPVLRGLDAETGARPMGEASPTALVRLWETLKATILRPIPALAYLAVALIGVVWILRGGGPGISEQGPAMLLPVPIVVHGEIAMRGVETAPPPMRIVATAGTPLRLALRTDLDPEETSPGAPRLRLVLRRGTDVLWSAAVDPGTIPADGALEMALQPERLPRDVPLELTLQRDATGEQPPLFLKRIVLAGPDE